MTDCEPAMAEGNPASQGTEAVLDEHAGTQALSRKEKRKLAKKKKRHEVRCQVAEIRKKEEEAEAQDPAKQLQARLEEEAEREAIRLEQEQHEKEEALWLERERIAQEDAERKREKAAKEEAWRKKRAEEEAARAAEASKAEEADDEEEVDGPPEIIWKGNEIIVRKKKVKKGTATAASEAKDQPTHNPFPPPKAYKSITEVAILHTDAHRTEPDAEKATPRGVSGRPDFGTERDRENCPFFLKTGVCRFGERCSRQHLYPSRSSVILFRNFYVGIGMATGREEADQDEELEYDEAEAQRHFEEFYEDIHPEFAIYGELVNLKVCRNQSPHLKGNVYVAYRTPEAAVQALTGLNGRFYAGKQIFGELSPIASWKQAICGTYDHNMKCSRGSHCNFLHCFRNPNNEYHWADKDRDQSQRRQSHRQEEHRTHRDRSESGRACSTADDYRREGRERSSQHRRSHRNFVRQSRSREKQRRRAASGSGEGSDDEVVLKDRNDRSRDHRKRRRTRSGSRDRDRSRARSLGRRKERRQANGHVVDSPSPRSPVESRGRWGEVDEEAA